MLKSKLLRPLLDFTYKTVCQQSISWVTSYTLLLLHVSLNPLPGSVMPQQQLKIQHRAVAVLPNIKRQQILTSCELFCEFIIRVFGTGCKTLLFSGKSNLARQSV
jgi:hypothetical protein